MRRISPRQAVFSIIWSLVLLFPTVGSSFGVQEFIETRLERYESAITNAATRYVGSPYGFIEKADGVQRMDNSHLFYQIYREAAEVVGMRYRGYTPMEQLLDRMVPVEREDVRAGDLIVLEDGLAAMIYQIEDDDTLHMVYVSGKRLSVISFNSNNVVFDAYWMNYLKGFYRLTPDNFHPAP